MSVYPKIDITESEDKYYVPFDVTENTVLIPMLYVRKFKNPSAPEYSETSAASKLYTSAKEFVNDMKIGGGNEGAGARYCYVNEVPDRSYVMAYNLLLRGMNVVLKPIIFENGTIGHWDEGNIRTNIAEATYYQVLEEAINDGALEEFKDRNVYNIKFITSGGYPNRGVDYVDSEGEYVAKDIFQALINVASKRTDAVALVEMKEQFESKQAFIDKVKDMSRPASGEFAVGFFPWCRVDCVMGVSEKEYSMPAAYCYLAAYAESTMSNANWFAASGVNRGAIPGFKSANFEVGEDLMRWLQGNEDTANARVRINPIMNAGTYGYRIWGNKVYIDGAGVSYKQLYKNFLNVRILVCDIKKQVYHAAMRTTFEPNDDVTWLNFKSLANTLLDKMKAGRGLKWYKWYRVEADDRAIIKAKLRVRPIEAVEEFDIEVVLTDQEDNLAETNEI